MYSICGWFPMFPVYLRFSSEIFPERWGLALSSARRSNHRGRALPGWRVEVCAVLGTPWGPQSTFQCLGGHLLFMAQRFPRSEERCFLVPHGPAGSLSKSWGWACWPRHFDNWSLGHWSISLFCSHATALLSHKWCDWEHVGLFSEERQLPSHCSYLKGTPSRVQTPELHPNCLQRSQLSVVP